MITDKERDYFSGFRCMSGLVVIKPLIEKPTGLVVSDVVPLIRSYGWVVSSGIEGVGVGDRVLYKQSGVLTEKGQLLRSVVLTIDELVEEGDMFSGLYLVLDFINVIGVYGRG